MSVREEKEAGARQRRFAGETYEGIAEALGVNERTIRRWSVSWKEAPESQVLRLPQSPVLEGKEWPGWTLDDLSDLPDFQRDLWQSNLDLIDSQAAQGQHMAGWFFKNLVELARRQDMPDSSLNWSLAIAGLPVLADWLECPPCTVLATLIEKHRPWEGNRLSRQRGAYQRETRTVSAEVRRCVDQARALIVMDDFAQKRQSPVTGALAILAERIPMFDRTPRRSRYRTANLGGAILGILSAPKN